MAPSTRSRPTKSSVPAFWRDPKDEDRLKSKRDKQRSYDRRRRESTFTLDDTRSTYNAELTGNLLEIKQPSLFSTRLFRISSRRSDLLSNKAWRHFAAPDFAAEFADLPDGHSSASIGTPMSGSMGASVPNASVPRASMGSSTHAVSMNNSAMNNSSMNASSMRASMNMRPPMHASMQHHSLSSSMNRPMDGSAHTAMDGSSNSPVHNSMHNSMHNSSMDNSTTSPTNDTMHTSMRSSMRPSLRHSMHNSMNSMDHAIASSMNHNMNHNMNNSMNGSMDHSMNSNMNHRIGRHHRGSSMMDFSMDSASSESPVSPLAPPAHIPRSASSSKTPHMSERRPFQHHGYPHQASTPPEPGMRRPVHSMVFKRAVPMPHRAKMRRHSSLMDGIEFEDVVVPPKSMRVTPPCIDPPYSAPGHSPDRLDDLFNDSFSHNYAHLYRPPGSGSGNQGQEGPLGPMMTPTMRTTV